MKFIKFIGIKTNEKEKKENTNEHTTAVLLNGEV